MPTAAILAQDALLVYPYGNSGRQRVNENKHSTLTHTHTADS